MSFCDIVSTMTSYSMEKTCHCFKPVNDTRDEESPAGKVVVITGANDGIGKMTALQMAKRKAIVVMGCRDMDKAATAVQEIKSQQPGAELHFFRLDLGDLTSVREFAGKVKQKFKAVNILINNAGVMISSPELLKTKDGFEMQMGVNLLGHVLLTLLLLDLLKKGSPSRIIFVASMLHKCSRLSLDDFMCENAKNLGYNNYVPYSNSKLAMILYARGLAKRLENTGVNTYSLCPGLVKTQLTTKYNQKRPCNCLLRCVGDINVEKGTETTLFCSLSKKCANESGNLYRFGHRWNSKIVRKIPDDFVEKLVSLVQDLVGYNANEEEVPAVVMSPETTEDVPHSENVN